MSNETFQKKADKNISLSLKNTSCGWFKAPHLSPITGDVPCKQKEKKTSLPRYCD